MAIRNYDEWIVNGFKHQHPAMSFMEISCTMIDEDIAYLFPSALYRILWKHNLITPWNGFAHPLNDYFSFSSGAYTLFAAIY